jgi:hypothetical protein
MKTIDKPLSFRQEMKIEHYLVTRETYLDDTDNKEVKEVLDEVTKELETFLTLEEIEGLDQYLQVQEEEPEPETLEFSILLPSGWKADDFEAGVPEIQLDIKNKMIFFSTVIQPKPLEDNEF